MKENKVFSISIEDNSDIDIDVLDKALLIFPAETYIELFNKMKRRLCYHESTCSCKEGK